MKPWTSSELARLNDMRTQGMTISAIGDVLGRSKNSVASRLKRVGQKPKGDPVERNTERAQRDRAMAADYVGGLTQVDLAKKYGLTKNYVAKCLALRGIKLTEEMRYRRISQGLAASPYRSGPAGIPAELRSDYINIRRTGFSPPEAKAMLGLAA